MTNTAMNIWVYKYLFESLLVILWCSILFDGKILETTKITINKGLVMLLHIQGLEYQATLQKEAGFEVFIMETSVEYIIMKKGERGCRGGRGRRGRDSDSGRGKGRK